MQFADFFTSFIKKSVICFHDGRLFSEYEY